VNPFSFALARVLVRIEDVAMANIVSRDGSGTRAVPELLQNQATPEAIAAAASAFLDDPAKAAEARRRLSLGREELGPAGAADRAAEALLSALGLAAGSARESGK
jgi:lipid-A-disaccharide synthase